VNTKGYLSLTVADYPSISSVFIAIAGLSWSNTFSNEIHRNSLKWNQVWSFIIY